MSEILSPKQALIDAAFSTDGELVLEFHNPKQAKAFRTKMNHIRRANPDNHRWQMLNLSVRGSTLYIEDLTPISVRKVKPGEQDILS